MDTHLCTTGPLLNHKRIADTGRGPGVARGLVPRLCKEKRCILRRLRLRRATVCRLTSQRRRLQTCATEDVRRGAPCQCVQCDNVGACPPLATCNPPAAIFVRELLAILSRLTMEQLSFTNASHSATTAFLGKSRVLTLACPDRYHRRYYKPAQRYQRKSRTPESEGHTRENN